MLRLLPRTAWVSGSVRFEGRTLYELPAREMRALRGDRLAVIMQTPPPAWIRHIPLGGSSLRSTDPTARCPVVEAWKCGESGCAGWECPPPKSGCAAIPTS